MTLTFVLSLILSIFAYPSANAQDPDPNDMRYEKQVTICFYNGVYWQDQHGDIFTHIPTNRKYLKAHHALTEAKSNRDYNKKGVGMRSKWRYLCNANNGFTYYFNM